MFFKCSDYFYTFTNWPLIYVLSVSGLQSIFCMNLKKDYTIVIVTHNMQQAARISDYTGFFLMGELIEFGQTKQIFQNPKEKSTEDYITGRFG